MCNKENLGCNGLVKNEDKNRYTVQFMLNSRYLKQKKTKTHIRVSMHPIILLGLGHKWIIQPEAKRCAQKT